MKRFREVIRGRFVSRAAAEASPGTTVGESIRRVDVLETCLRQVAADMDQAAAYVRANSGGHEDVQIAEMLEQSAAAAREVATDDGDGQ